MIWDIVLPRKFSNYRSNRGPFVLLLYKPDEPRNKTVYFAVRNICNQYKDVPFLRFDYASLRISFPKEILFYADLLILEKSHEHRFVNIIEHNQLHAILKYVSDKRFYNLKIHNKDYRDSDRSIRQAWSLYGKRFSFLKHKSDFVKDIDSEYFFPNSTSLFRNMEFMVRRKIDMEKAKVKRSQNKFELNSCKINSEKHISKMLANKSTLRVPKTKRNIALNLPNEINYDNEIKKHSQMSNNKSITKNNSNILNKNYFLSENLITESFLNISGQKQSQQSESKNIKNTHEISNYTCNTNNKITCKTISIEKSMDDKIIYTSSKSQNSKSNFLKVKNIINNIRDLPNIPKNDILVKTDDSKKILLSDNIFNKSKNYIIPKNTSDEYLLEMKKHKYYKPKYHALYKNDYFDCISKFDSKTEDNALENMPLDLTISRKNKT